MTRRRVAGKPGAPDSAKARADALIARMGALGSAANLAGMARYGIATASAFGVATPQLQAMAREIGHDHELAAALWSTGVREARILAAYIADPAKLTSRRMEKWVRNVDSWDVCDNCCLHLFRRSPLAWECALRWSSDDAELVKRAGFALVATLAVHDKVAADAKFLAMLPVIEIGAEDDRNFVNKAVNWALRQIGKRNLRLQKAAVRTSKRLMKSASKSARWIGSDALRELESPAVRTRLADKTARGQTRKLRGG